MSKTQRNKRNLLLGPAAFFLIVFYLAPLLAFFSQSVMGPDFGLVNYKTLLASVSYRNVIWNTIEISLFVTILSLMIGYPLGYAAHRASGLLRKFMLLSIVLPFWIGFLVRTFALMSILRRTGLINELLLRFQVIDTPVSLMYNRIGAIVGMVYMLYPYLALSIFVVLEGINRDMELVAKSLGASPAKVFWSTTLPLSIPGVTAGALIVFALSLGFFVTPALMGGRGEQMLSMVIEDQVNTVLNWGVAAALAVILVVVTGLTLLAVAWIVRKFMAERGIDLVYELT